MKAKLLLLVLSASIIHCAQETPLQIALKAIAHEEPEYALHQYDQLKNKDEQEQFLIALYKLSPNDIRDNHDWGKLIQITWAFVNKNPKSDLESGMMNYWKRSLATRYPPFAERYNMYVEPRTPSPAPLSSPSASSATINLISKEGKEFPILRAVATNEQVSKLLASMLVVDKHATSLTLPLLPNNILQIIAPLLGGTHKLVEQFGNDDRAITISIVTKIRENDLIRNFARKYALQLIIAAHYLQSPYLRTAFLWELAAALQDSPAQAAQLEVTKKHLTPDLLAELSKAFFLQFDRDVDQQLGLPHQPIDLATLKAYGKLPDWWDEKMPMRDLLLSFKIPAEADKDRMLGALLKLSRNKIDQGPHGTSAIFFATAAQTKLLIAAGANVNKQDTGAGVTPLINELKKIPLNIEKIQLLLANGATPELSQKDGRDALTYLMQSKADNAPEIVPLLIAKMTNQEQMKKGLAQAQKLFQEWEIKNSPYQGHFVTLLHTIIQSLSKRLGVSTQAITPEVAAAFTELGLPTTATADEVKKAWRKLSLVHHPDKGGIKEKAISINNAYAILKEHLGIK